MQQAAVTMALNYVDETDRPLHKRSYLHYAVHKPELLGAKVAATRWLLQGCPRPVKSVREYMAGIGIQSLLAQERFKPARHVVADMDSECVSHLVQLGFNARGEDARRAMLEPDNSDLRLVDFPAGSVLHVQGKWRAQFNALFASLPKAVVWTDTSISYHIAVHGARYAKALGALKLTSKEDYVHAYSAWLSKEWGYFICRAAVRGTNALYLCAIPGEGSPEIEYFPLENHKHLFKGSVI